jgi:hypothetical protein
MTLSVGVPAAIGISRFVTRLLTLATLAVCVAAGAALNVYRVSSWKTTGFHSPRGFQDPPERVDGMRAHWARSFAKVEIFNQRWRPMRVTVTLRAFESAPPEDASVRVSADRRVMGTFALQAAWSRHSFVVTDTAPFDGRLWLQFERVVVPADDRGLAFADVEMAPVFALRPILVHGASGAVLGALTWFLLSPRRWHTSVAPAASLAASPAVATFGKAPGRLASIALASVLFVYFCGWALLRPPFQTPDEPQHHMRMTSILLHP